MDFPRLSVGTLGNVLREFDCRYVTNSVHESQLIAIKNVYRFLSQKARMVKIRQAFINAPLTLTYSMKQ